MRWRDIKNRKNTKPTQDKVKVIYGKFWTRLIGFSTDLFMIGMPITLAFMIIFGHDTMNKAGFNDAITQSENAINNAPDPMISILQIVISLVIYVTFWYTTTQTPGKKFANIRVVDAKTFKRASIFKLTIRYLGYFISALPLFLGFFIGLFREDNRTLHDLISGTAVIYVEEE